MSIPQVLAVLYAVVTGLVAAFQVALALGAPWGAYAMGGGFPGRMPVRCGSLPSCRPSCWQHSR